jgi:hypothetical protein
MLCCNDLKLGAGAKSALVAALGVAALGNENAVDDEPIKASENSGVLSEHGSEQVEQGAARESDRDVPAGRHGPTLWDPTTPTGVAKPLKRGRSSPDRPQHRRQAGPAQCGGVPGAREIKL